ncbi:MAG: twin-arginine translocase subunit TatC [Candidatus Omnitrophica bacterium]|nr:twin-arginine translocase subunit TatC [Candidatus Omnitrophota bacterium]MCM8826563.1 twin-arginine translocase subunit TatC [Candidatus Omnitrophota bacterium]
MGKFLLKEVEDKPLPFLEHLEELRRRLIYSIVVITIFSIISHRFVPLILKNLVKSTGKLVFISPTEAFLVNIKLTLFLGIYLSLPFLFYQIWVFLGKGLKKDEKKIILPLSFISFILFNTGGFLCYFFIIPMGIKLLFSYSLGIIEPMISVNSYLSFILGMIFSFGLIFELPLIMLFLTKIGLVSPLILRKYRRVVIVAIFIVSAILTPPDIFTQIALALPLIVLYELSIIVSKILTKLK